MKKIVIFASGSGSNAENIIRFFEKNKLVEVSCVFCNNPDAKVIEKAKINNVETFIFNKVGLIEGEVLQKLEEIIPDLIVLAGFLWKFPESIIRKFPNKIINIHPALLPNYGGKGMYGMNVHQAVFDNKEVETGITIHYVNENYDEGEIIFQKNTDILNCKSPNEIAQKIHELEMENFPKVIDGILNSRT
ncbi:MAG TPA: phosphoribosylglycinamide formyltransferase [Flavobacterium sp.]|jgi:phosphoribosylglycinamide formyltransferase-1|nr:phosphoribosylglycinamide formyltransferase [Flavobacterium sp.]